MKALVIGFGSIGKRHARVLSDIDAIHTVDVVTRQHIDSYTTYQHLSEVQLEDYDYFVIASETAKHFEQLLYITSNVSGKSILCEKPLFDFIDNQRHMLIDETKNKIVIGYTLRFHPILQKVREIIQTEKVYNIIVTCGQYLPTWRPDVDYRQSYSAKKSLGGGVLLDLSHEIDYIQWLFGEVVELKSYQTTISDLEIETDDLCMFIGKTNRKVFINVSLDYISKIPHRHIFINTEQFSYNINLIDHTIAKQGKTGTIANISVPPIDRDRMFHLMHTSTLTEENTASSYAEAVGVMNTVAKIQGAVS